MESIKGVPTETLQTPDRSAWPTSHFYLVPSHSQTRKNTNCLRARWYPKDAINDNGNNVFRASCAHPMDLHTLVHLPSEYAALEF